MAFWLLIVWPAIHHSGSLSRFPLMKPSKPYKMITSKTKNDSQRITRILEEFFLVCLTYGAEITKTTGSWLWDKLCSLKKPDFPAQTMWADVFTSPRLLFTQKSKVGAKQDTRHHPPPWSPGLPPPTKPTDDTMFPVKETHCPRP